MMTKDDINIEGLRLATHLIRRYGAEDARKIAKKMHREVRLPTAAEMTGILQIIETNESTMPFGD